MSGKRARVQWEDVRTRIGESSHITSARDPMRRRRSYGRVRCGRWRAWLQRHARGYPTSEDVRRDGAGGWGRAGADACCLPPRRFRRVDSSVLPIRGMGRVALAASVGREGWMSRLVYFLVRRQCFTEEDIK